MLLAVGAATAAWATVGRADPDIGHPRKLVTTGAYAVTRNPMYVGWHLVHLGAALVAGSAWGLVTLAVAVAQVDREIKGEEALLLGCFGPEFERYVRTVPRYLGTRASD